MEKIIKVPEEVRDTVQRADVEQSARKEIIMTILRDNIDIPKERMDKYQKEYDEKFFAFEQAKGNIEKEYVQPAVDGKASNWSLDYHTCELTVTY